MSSFWDWLQLFNSEIGRRKSPPHPLVTLCSAYHCTLHTPKPLTNQKTTFSSPNRARTFSYPTHVEIDALASLPFPIPVFSIPTHLNVTPLLLRVSFPFLYLNHFEKQIVIKFLRTYNSLTKLHSFQFLIVGEGKLI